MIMAQEFRCIHCGERFELNRHEQEVYEYDEFEVNQDECEDCYSLEDLFDRYLKYII